MPDSQRPAASRAPSPKTGFVLTAGIAFVALFVGALAMGISPVFVRNAETGPFVSAFWRVALALPVLAVWALWSRGPVPVRDIVRSRAVLLSGVFFAGDLIFWHLAIVNTSIANATFCACLAPLWVALLSRITLGEAVPRRTVYGLFACIPGAALLILHSSGSGTSHWLGDLYGIATSFFFGLYFLVVRSARRTMTAGETVFASSVVTTAFLFVAALVSGEALLPQGLSGAANLAALGLVSHAGGQGLLALALGVLSASFSSLVIFIEAVAAAIFAYLFAGEALSLMQTVGGVLILAGIWVARPRPSPPVPPAAL